MKKVLPIVLGLIFSFQISQGQVKQATNEVNQLQYDFLMSKHKKQKTGGLIFLVGGVASMAAGFVTNRNANKNSDGYDLSSVATGAGFIAVGVISTIISIPLLISSGKNKRKAEAFIASENIGFKGMPAFNTRYVSVGLSIDF